MKEKMTVKELLLLLAAEQPRCETCEHVQENRDELCGCTGCLWNIDFLEIHDRYYRADEFRRVNCKRNPELSFKQRSEDDRPGNGSSTSK
jgi:hypothetical protein